MKSPNRIVAGEDGLKSPGRPGEGKGVVNHAVSNGLASEFVRCQKWVKPNSINTLSKILVQNNLNIFVGNSSKVIHEI